MPRGGPPARISDVLQSAIEALPITTAYWSTGMNEAGVIRCGHCHESLEGDAVDESVLCMHCKYFNAPPDNHVWLPGKAPNMWGVGVKRSGGG